ncbi:unnamed protein product [marine sediment metagenome]|uniref:Uncharacterized protein n=1 Tax=marine sediment metagenome TaxID=412755 RepID=X0UJU8_9ZZZZ
MRTLIGRMKTVLQSDGTLSGYVKKVEITAPRTLPEIKTTTVPWIGIAPVNSPESWYSNGKKQVFHTVELYLVHWYKLQEVSIYGDGNKAGILELIEDTISAVRGNYFASGAVNYLDKPTDITNIEYTTAGYGDNVFLIVATITLSCQRIFSV